MNSGLLVLGGIAAALMVGAVVPLRNAQRDPAPLLAAQREAMKRLSYLDGVWRGSAWTMLPSGEKHTITQTERVGPFLDGAVRVVEGRGYDADGSVGFNTLGIISYDQDRKAYSMKSYAQGRTGDFVVTPSANGFSWEIAAGPMTIRYTATIDAGTWHEVGDRIASGQSPVRFFEMTLTRVGDTTWPAGDAVPMK